MMVAAWNICEVLRPKPSLIISGSRILAITSGDPRSEFEILEFYRPNLLVLFIEPLEFKVLE